jgi:hypothetical protein
MRDANDDGDGHDELILGQPHGKHGRNVRQWPDVCRVQLWKLLLPERVLWLVGRLLRDWVPGRVWLLWWLVFFVLFLWPYLVVVVVNFHSLVYIDDTGIVVLILVIG